MDIKIIMENLNKKMNCSKCLKYTKILKTYNRYTIGDKHFFCNECGNNDDKIIQEKEVIEIFKVFCLIDDMNE